MKLVIRQTIRLIVLGALVAATWPHMSLVSNPVLAPSLSPFIVASASIATQTIGLLALAALPVLVLVAVFPRFFCHFACPVGLLQEFVEKWSPFSRKTVARTPNLGMGIVALTLGGACVGVPFFIWMDPLAMFNGFMASWRQPLTTAGLLGGCLLPLLLVLDFLFPRVWCQRICPLGATQDMIERAKSKLYRHKKCLSETDDSHSPQALKPDGRRFFLGTLAGALLGRAGLAGTGAQAPLRPPGSLSERQFSSVCIRCGNCAQACPSRIIRPDITPERVTHFYAPILQFSDDYCRENCNRCHEVCPSGAIQRLSLAQKRGYTIGPAIVDTDNCLMAIGRECTSCIAGCPYQAIVVRSVDNGFSREPQVQLDKCTGCGACEAICPVRPQRAIRVKASPAKLA